MLPDSDWGTVRRHVGVIKNIYRYSMRKWNPPLPSKRIHSYDNHFSFGILYLLLEIRMFPNSYTYSVRIDFNALSKASKTHEQGHVNTLS